MKSLYGIAGANSRMIPNTAFLNKSVDTKYFSRKNTIPSRVTQVVQSILYEPFATAIVTSQSNDYNVFAGEKEGKKFFLGCYKNGANTDYCMFDEDGNNFIVSSDKSKVIPEMMIAVQRYLEPKGEIDETFRLIDFSNSFIDTNQEKQFRICADSLVFTIQELFNHKEVEVLRTAGSKAQNLEKIKAALPYLKEDITAFSQNSYDEEIKEAGQYLKIEKLPVKRPIEIIKPKTEKELIEEYKNKDFSLLSEKDIREMPEQLQDGYYLARSAFNENKAFFTLHDWMLIEQLYTGDVQSVNFIGPAGVGKTTTIRAIAGALGLPFILVGGSAGIEESDLFGYQALNAEDGVTIMRWVDGPITQAIRYGAFLLFDEINAADPGVVMKLNTILDGSKIITLSNAETVKVHSHFRFAEAMNIGSGYNGTDKLNLSHFDRMDQIYKMSAKSIKEEANIIKAITGYKNLENLKKMCTVKQEICNLIAEEGGESDMIISPRRLIQWIKRAAITQEFVDSSLNTVISHLAIYDDTITTLSKEEVLNSSSLASTALALIEKTFNNIDY